MYKIILENAIRREYSDVRVHDSGSWKMRFSTSELE
jgi:hypothetical protein